MLVCLTYSGKMQFKLHCISIIVNLCVDFIERLQMRCSLVINQTFHISRYLVLVHMFIFLLIQERISYHLKQNK